MVVVVSSAEALPIEWRDGCGGERWSSEERTDAGGMMNGEGAEVKFVADLQPALCLFG